MTPGPPAAREVGQVTGAVAELRDLPAAPGDRRWSLAVRYLLVVAIEGCADLAQGLCASEGWGPPRSKADAVSLLARHGVVDGDLTDPVVRALAFGDALLRAAPELDDERVVAMLDRLGDLDAFGAEVAAWVRARS